MLRNLFLWFVKGTPVYSELLQVEKDLGVKIVFEQYISLRTLSRITAIYKKLLPIMKDPYLKHRITEIRKTHPSYKFDPQHILSIYVESPKKTVSYLKKLDALAHSVLQTSFPDQLLPATPYPGSGPYYDFFKQLSQSNTMVSPILLMQDLTDLPLLQSSKLKQFKNPKTLTQNDIKYLVSYYRYLTSKPNYLKTIFACLESQSLRLILPLVFHNEPRQSVLTWDPEIIDLRIEMINKILKLVEEDPSLVNDLNQLIKNINPEQ